MKKIIFVVITLLNLSSHAQVPSSGLVGYWPFTGNANDLSGNANNGTVSNAVLVSDRFGNPNCAYSFNGTNAQINVPSSSTLVNFPNGQTLSFWMKITALPTDGKEHYMIDKTDNTSKYYQAFISDFTNVDNIVYRYGQSSTISSQGTAIPFANLPINQWFNICFTTDLTVTKTYINGIHFQTFTQYSPIGINANPLIFGNTNIVNSTNAPYNGNLDDIRIYNRPLDSAEVHSLYNEGICYQNITVTDTLLINTTITGFNPVTYQNTIKVWPNPTNDHITIDNGNISNLTGYQLKITNSLGQQVFQSAITQQQFYVDLSTWSGNGLYFLHIIDATGNIIDIKKIVLQ